MARSTFGAGLADFVVRPSDGLWAVAPGAAVTFWDAHDAGTQYTDLLDSDGSPATAVTADAHGMIPSLQGPDSITGMWADAGGASRAWISPRGAATGGGGGGGGGFTSLTRVVASATAPTDVRATATYVCDGVADQVQIQAAVDDARDHGGGVVQLTVGDYNLTAPITFEGTDDVDVEVGISLWGQGAKATMLNAGSGLTSAIHLTKVVRVNFADLGITISGATHGISSATTNGASSGHRSFWNSSFRNLQIYGPWDGSGTGYAMFLGSPFRSVFENIEIGGVGGGWYMFSEHADFNPGDLTVNRSFVDLSGDNKIAYRIDSPAGTMNQTNWTMCEAYSNGVGCTAVLVNGSHNRMWGNNLEQFITLIEVEAGEGNEFEYNYVTGEDGGVGNKSFVCGTDAWNNTFRAKKLNIHAGDTVMAVQDANLSAAAPNIFERICIEANTGSSTTYSKVASTVFRDITAFLDGGTIQAGLLQYPLSGANSPDTVASEHGLATWTSDPAGGGATATSVSGVMYLSKVKIVNRSTVVSAIHVTVTTAGAGLTSGQNRLGLYDSSGTLLATSADMTTDFGTTGFKTGAITPQTLAVGTYFVAILTNATTTQVVLATGASGNTTVNANLSGAARRFMNSGTAQTALPGSVSLSGATTNVASRWAALS